MRGLFTGLFILFGSMVGNLWAQSPGGVPTSLNLWLKANSGPEKSPGVAAGNGDAISLWKDRSGLGRDYTVVAGPTLLSNTLNFNPSVEILNGGFDAPAGSELSTNWTLFFVSKKLPSDSDGRLFDGNTGNNLWAHWGPYTNSIYLEGSPGDYNVGTATTTGVQNLHLHAYKRAAAGSLENRADGSILTTYAGTSSASGIRIDIDQGTYSSGGESSDARVGEMIMYSAALTATEVNKVESYLGIKYGLTLGHDYLASDGTTIWNRTTNLTYHNDVAGIGRDDNSALDQRQSLSVNASVGVTMQTSALAAFGADKNFILFGNDAANGTSSNISSTYSLRAKRIWKVAVAGAPGAVTVSLDLSAAGLPNTGNAVDYSLLRDGDTDFSSVVPAPVVATSLVGTTLTFNVPSFTDGQFFTVATSNLVLPGGAAGLFVWLKADSGPEKSPGVAAGNGDAISLWKDKSGFAHDYTVAAGPTLQSASLNFNPSVEILSGGFDAPVGSEMSTDWTVFFISKKLPSDDIGRLFEGNTGNNLWAHWGNFTNSIYLEGNPSNYNSGIATTTGIQNLHLHSYKRASSGSLEARADGSSLTTFVGSNSVSGIRMDIGQGFYAAGGGESSDARVGEMIMFNTALTGTEVNKVESYLGIKYGLTLAHDYLASDGTVIWNSTTNATYHHDVAGIGNDGSLLNQPKSLSVNTGAAVTIGAVGAIPDKNFLFWGNDAANGTSNNISSTYTLRSTRIWKTAVTGTPGAMTVTVDLLALGMPNTTQASDYALLRDTDTDFSTVGPAPVVASGLSGSTVTFDVPAFTDGQFFTIAVSNVVVPGGVAGLVFWVKGDAGIASVSVDRWADQSGFMNDAVQPVPAKQPLQTLNNINFNPSVNFFLPSTIMTLTTPPVNLNATVFTVAIPTVNSDWRTMFRGVVNDHPIIVENGGTRLGYYDNDNAGFNPSGFTWLQNEKALVALEMRSGNVNFRKNGVQGGSIGGIILNGLNLDYFGAYQGGSQNFGRIAETIVFNTSVPLSTTEKNKIESYLAIKYGLTVAHDYLASDGTVVWNSTTNALYHFDVAGIGKDISGSLDQPKSLSVNTGAAVTMQAATVLSNKNFVLWGNDATTGTSTNISSSYTLRAKRVWKTAVTGAPGAITVSVDVSALGLPDTGNAADYALLRDVDTDFSSVVPAPVVASSLTLNTLTFSVPSFTNGQFFTIAVANVPVPGGVFGLTAWLKGDAGVNGIAAIDTWADQSGNGNSAIQPTSVKQPSLTINDINSHASVNFFQPSSIMSFSAPTTDLNSTIFAVAVPTVNTDWRTMFRGSAGHHPLLIESGGIRLGFYDNNTGSFLPSGFNWLQNEVALVGLEMRATTNFRKNGTLGSTISGINLTGRDLDFLGAYQGGSQNFGRIAEVIIYNTASALTTTEKNKVESYLAVKYGITLAHDYVATDGTVTWNTTTNAAYQNRVTGIGKDATTGLDQRISVSAHLGAVVTMLTPSLAPFGADKNFLLWGDNNAAMAASGVADYPVSQGLIGRIARTWKLAKTGAVGLVTIRFNLSSIPGSKTAADLRLLIDRDKNGAFANEINGAGVLNGAVDLGSDVFEFANITLNDGELISIGTVSNSTPLPITLTTLTAIAVDNAVKISWSTASEINNDYFTLQKSLTGTEFMELARIKGAGNSTVTTNYNYVDTSPMPGMNYYRLKQTDFDSNSSLSTIVKVDVSLDLESNSNSKIYPNPTAGEFSIDVLGAENAEFVMSNTLGQRVNVNYRRESGKFVVDATSLPRGMYLITIHAGDKTESKKIILQ